MFLFSQYRFCLVFNSFFLLLLKFTLEKREFLVFSKCIFGLKKIRLSRVKRTLSFIYLLDMVCVESPHDVYVCVCFYFSCGGQKFILSGLSIYHPWQEALLSCRVFFFLITHNKATQSCCGLFWRFGSGLCVIWQAFMLSYTPPAETLQTHLIQQMYKISFVCSGFNLNLHNI